MNVRFKQKNTYDSLSEQVLLNLVQETTLLSYCLACMNFLVCRFILVTHRVLSQRTQPMFCDLNIRMSLAFLYLKSSLGYPLDKTHLQ